MEYLNGHPTNPTLLYLSFPITHADPVKAYNDAEGLSGWIVGQTAGAVRGVNPLRYTIRLYDRARKEFPHDSETEWKYVHDRCLFDVRRCDAVVVNLCGATKASIGACFEMAWAVAFNKPVFLAIENENVHRHPMVVSSATALACDPFEAARLALTFVYPDPDPRLR